MTVVAYKGMSWNKEEDIVYPEKLNATWAIDKLWKYQLEGKTTFNFHHNSIVYSPEVVLATYSPAAPVRKHRADNNGWYRNETPFPINTATRDFFFNAFVSVDARLKGVR